MINVYLILMHKKTVPDNKFLTHASPTHMISPRWSDTVGITKLDRASVAQKGAENHNNE